MWLFGGLTDPNQFQLNDLWKYDTSTEQWIWIRGSKFTGQPGSYGTLGVSSPTNDPSARHFLVSWEDNAGNLWLFGGIYGGRLNDLWKYSIATNEWTWMRGSSSIDQRGIYGTLGTPAPTNDPGARQGATGIKASDGSFWLFGGYGFGEVYGGTLNDLWHFDPTTNQWAWMSGSKSIAQAAVYGSLGVEASGNVPGSRTEASSWRDNAGFLWVFGGSSNELWRFNPTTGYWACFRTGTASGNYSQKGTPSAAVIPGPRGYAVTWNSGLGTLWLLGGGGVALASPGDTLSDLWKYDIASNQWTWVSGSSEDHNGNYGTCGVGIATNWPGARRNFGACTGPDGTMWLFGGDGYGQFGQLGKLNDLWKFDPGTRTWTWVHGAKLAGQYAIYGSKGIPAPANMPGTREGAVLWADKSGNLWLFGGHGLAASGSAYYRNELWRYDIASNQWAWVSTGTSTTGVYGTKGVAAATNWPGARGSAASWTDSGGKLWMFGGYGLDASSSSEGNLNDLWKLDPLTGWWTWVNGSNETGQLGIYGTKGVASPTNSPGGRSLSGAVYSGNSLVFVFGGSGLPQAPFGTGTLNDLWKYDPAANLWTWLTGDIYPHSPGIYGQIGVPSAANTPSARQEAFCWVDTYQRLWLFGGVGAGGYWNDLCKFDSGSGQWTWVAGNNTGGMWPSISAGQGIPSATNIAGSRIDGRGWFTPPNRLWLFGGTGASFDATGLLKDLWYIDLNGPAAATDWTILE
jgi:N-acetylneuraminic acid mutarotase